MLAIVFGDIQINSYKQYNTDNCRLLNCIKALNEVFQFAHSKKIEYILFDGDLYDTQKILGTEVVNETVATFLSWYEKDPSIKFIAISGNHDQATKNLLHKPAVTGLSHLDHACPNFYLIDNSNYSIEKVTDEGTLSGAIWGVPYYERKEDFIQALTAIAAKPRAKSFNILMIHQTPSNLGNDMIPVDVDISNPLFDSFDFVYCGHIHQHALLSEKFMLVGSPLHRTLEDLGSDKGFIVTDLTRPREGYKFVSLNKKLSIFRRLAHDEEILPEWDKDYILRLPVPFAKTKLEAVDTDKFKADLTPQELFTNYWEKMDGSDKDLLKVGLELLK